MLHRINKAQNLLMNYLEFRYPVNIYQFSIAVLIRAPLNNINVIII